MSGKYERNQPPPAGVRLEKWKERWSDCDNDRGWRTLDAVKAIAKEKETTAAAVSLAWLLAKPTVTSVIFGARTLEQLDDNLGSVDVTLTAAQIARLDELSTPVLPFPASMAAMEPALMDGGTNVNGRYAKAWAMTPATDDERW